MDLKFKYLFICCVLASTTVTAQQQQGPNVFDYGKMWTFENPPKEWFKKAYSFEPGDQWFADVRKSSLRFASWCSASFISPNGLIMTNHHCSRDVVVELQKEGENFDKQGFYAARLEDERKAEGLFVEQMVMAEDVTTLVKEKMASADKSKEDGAAQEAALKVIKDMYAAKPEWEGLRLQTVIFYSGGKFSIYGYKKYSDIRLVVIPELDLGFFGGDPDNFTYPRYNLDCTFWRAYDENGKPLDTSKNYFKFNKDGAVEGEEVFVIGNPGRTERYRTASQYAYDRDYRYPSTFKFLKNRNDMMMEEYNTIKNDPAKEFEAQSLLNEIANVANSMKAFGGIVKGLKDPDLLGRKIAMENYIKSKSPGLDYWDKMAKAYEVLNPHGWAVSDLSPSPLRGKIFLMMHALYEYETAVKNKASEDDKKKMRDAILDMTTKIDNDKERRLFRTLLTEIKEDIYPGDQTLAKVLGKKSIEKYTEDLIKKTRFKDKDDAEKCLTKDDNILKDDDGMLEAARILIPRFHEASTAFQSSTADRKLLEQKIAKQAFNVFGNSLPPDATFTLRISDGVIKGYEYNGTLAPPFTTYYGLYDRYYSNKGEFPWALPKRWLNPSLEFLKSPFNTVSTNDIIGGNSGSPLINKKKEVVGLIFDGNIESLPGNFIFDEKLNRTVSVHAGGIYAALKYIIKADRIVAELDGQK